MGGGIQKGLILTYIIIEQPLIEEKKTVIPRSILLRFWSNLIQCKFNLNFNVAR